MKNQLKNFQHEISLLADRVECEWKKNNCELAFFADLSKSTLDDYQPNFVPDIDAFLLEFENIDLPKQTFPNHEFSDFPLTLARREKFSIDIYIWTHSDTNIHDHHFCGAFKIIKGNSIQIDYEFTKFKEVGNGLEEGDLRFLSYKKLPLNSTQAIEVGSKFIHHVFHLEKPTITLCIRTNFLKQLNLNSYLFPKYRIQHTSPNSIQQSKIRLLEVTLKCGVFPETIPFESSEILVLMYFSAINRLKVSSALIEELKKYLILRGIAPDFLEAYESRDQMLAKLKILGLKD